MLQKIKNISICLLLCTSFSYGQQTDLKLWYNKPAEKWTDALPIGNGRLGAMIYGGINEEHLQFNEETLWTGRPRDYQRNGANKYLDTIRKLLFEGKQKEAEALAEKKFMGLKDADDSLYVVQKKAWLKDARSPESIAAGLTNTVWETMSLPTLNGWETAGYEGIDGAAWFRNSFTLPETWKDKDLFVDLGRIRDVDYTYVNGQPIGSSEGISTKRHYKIPAAILKTGVNEITVQVINFFDKGGFTGIKTGRLFALYPAGDGFHDTLQLGSNWQYYFQYFQPPAFPQYEASYQPFGDVFFNFGKQGNITNYRRELDISNAVSTVSYTSNNIQFRREYFVSAPDQVLAMHFTASKPGSINLSSWFRSPHQKLSVKKIDDHTMALSVQVKNGALNGVSYMRVVAPAGKIIFTGDKVVIEGANEATFYLTAATNFVNYQDVSANAETKARQAVDALNGKKYADIKDAHVKEYQLYFNSFSVNFGRTKNALLPTDQRILQYTQSTDQGLLALYMQYARYLLISSSRSGTQPANLQGIWNDLLTPPWGSKYTSNINLQMNYWLADILNLSACNQPLFEMIKELAVTGKKTARAHYNADGWVLHHNTDLWRGTPPINAANHGIWPTGGAWLAQHIWDHYQFTKSEHFLRDYYPAMKEAAVFFTQFLVADPNTGRLISTPSNSPEHGGLVAGPTMDHQIIRELFKNCIAAAKQLKVDKDFSDILQKKYDSIAPNTIGSYGELQEWLKQQEDTTEHHRHVSHLWGVYPGTDITWKDTKMMNAARQSLLYRGDDGTGWSLAWKVNLWARFRDGNHAQKIVDLLLSPADDGTSEKGGVYKNLFDAHPPFQIDGNFGGAAGIAEMLVQSHEEYIEILPALPLALASGEVKGICARGGFVFNIKWKDHSLVSVEVLSRAGKKCFLKYGTFKTAFETVAGKRYQLNSKLKSLASKN